MNIQDIFEKNNPIPKGVERCSDYYVPSSPMPDRGDEIIADNYQARWEGFQEALIFHRQEVVNAWARGWNDCCAAKYRDTPDKWVLAPVNPTEEMMRAAYGWREWDLPDGFPLDSRVMYGAYRSMISAIPKITVEEDDG